MTAEASIEPGARRTVPTGIGVRALSVWFLVGVAVALVLQLMQASAFGGKWDALVTTGSQSPLRPVIEAELPDVTFFSAAGHDGQFSYVIALDPLRSDPVARDAVGGYRYRRVLYPAAAGLGGLLGGDALVASLVLWAAIGMGLATAAAVDVGARLGIGPLAALAVLANPGMWFSVQLLTADALAFGLALCGVAMFMRRSPWAPAVVAVAVLAKDQYLLIAVALAGLCIARGERMRGLRLGLVSVAPLLAWSLVVQSGVGGGLSSEGNLALPFVGVLRGIERWGATSGGDVALAVVALAAVVGAAIGALVTRSRELRWLVVPWVLLAVLVSHWVWQWGNNATRVFIPAFAFAVIALVEFVETRDEAPRHANQR